MIRKANISNIVNSEMLSSFDCGEGSVNSFLSKEALEYNRKNLFPTTIFYSVEDKRIVGFYALTSSIVEVKSSYDVNKFENLGAEVEDVESLSVLSYPATELAWFGVDRKYQNQKYGSSILLDAFRSVVGVKSLLNVGTVGIEVDSLPGAIEFYQRFGFSYLHVDYDNSMAMPDAYPMFVAMEDIESIIEELDK